MKRILITLVLLVYMTGLNAQETVIKDLHAFDKLIIDGEVEQLTLRKGFGEHPMIKLSEVDEKDVEVSIEAGVLHLKLKEKAARVEVYNKNLRRITGPENMHIAGAEVIGGDNGNYLVVGSTNNCLPFDSWASGDGFQFHLPEMNIDIPELDIAVDIPEFDFNFDFSEGLEALNEENFQFDMKFDEDWEADFKYKWENNKDAIKLWSEELSEEMRKALDEAREKMKEQKKDRE